MSVVNQMLKDLEERSTFDEGEDAEYQEPPETKRIRYMIMFILVVVVTAAAYFTWRAMGTDYFVDLYKQGVAFVSGEEEQQVQTKKVKVNSALEQIMPTRNTALDPKPDRDQTENNDTEVKVTNSVVSSEQQPPDVETTPVESSNQQNNVLQADTLDIVGQKDVPPEPETVQESAPPDELSIELSEGSDDTIEINELLSKAAQAMSEEDIVLAIRVYQEILEIDFRLHDIRKKLAVLHYTGSDIENAEDVLSDGIDVAPERTDFRLMLARLLYRQKRNNEAYGVLASIEPDVQRNIDYYGLKATVAQELLRDAEASHLYGRLVIFEPNRAQWWLGLAISLDRMGQKNGAIKAYENAADLRQLSASADDFIRQRILELGG